VEKQTIMDEAETGRVLDRLAHEIHAASSKGDGLVIVGIQRRGAELAERIARSVAELSGTIVPTGSLDISLYRDDFGQIGPRPIIGKTDVGTDISGRRVVIVDDVLFTGRTIRAALHELSDFGRSRCIELCVLVDRGERELPIQADYVGKRIEVPEGQQVSVCVPELDGELCVSLVTAESQTAQSLRPPERANVKQE
jgi:pyrimidine operon attenuation protein/uracil phosphoribosyltransferase